MTGSAPSGLSLRAQSSIIGVAILVAVTALSIGALTMSAGTFVEDGVAAANTQRVADDLADLDTSREGLTRIEFSRGTFRVEPRTIRVLRGERAVVLVEADAFIYESRGRRVTSLGGVLIEGARDRSRLHGQPPVVVGEERLLVDLVVLNTSGTTAVGGSDPVAVTIRTQPTHDYRMLDEGQYAIAIETETPSAWERAFAAPGVERSRRDFDEDGTPSVVVSAPRTVTVDLAIHDLRAVVRRG